MKKVVLNGCTIHRCNCHSSVHVERSVNVSVVHMGSSHGRCTNVVVMCFAFLFAAPESVPSGESQSVAGGDEDALDDYQELSTREEQDIESMMEMCEFAISNAEAFAEQLSRELQVLDGVSAATETLSAVR